MHDPHFHLLETHRPCDTNLRLEKIAVNTNWFETKTKFDPIYKTKIEKKRLGEKNKIALKQIKIIRNNNLQELYNREALQ